MPQPAGSVKALVIEAGCTAVKAVPTLRAGGQTVRARQGRPQPVRPRAWMTRT